MNAGLQYRLNQHSFISALQDNHFDLDSEGFLHAYGATEQWLHNINSNNQAGLYAQYSRLNYAGNSARNAGRKIVVVNAANVFKGDLTPVNYGTLYGGCEEARNEQVNFLSQDVACMRAGVQLGLTSKWQLQVSSSVVLRDNDEKDPIFLTKRNDRQYDALLDVNLMPAQDWSIKPQLSYCKNDSNIDLNNHYRTVISLSVRKDFSW